MKKIFTIILFIIISLTACAQNYTEYYFKFKIQEKSELNLFTRLISIDQVFENDVFAYATDADLIEFKKLGYEIIFLDNPSKSVKADMATTISEMSSWNKYPTYDLYVSMMENYAASYPNICKLINIGNTAGGRSLYVLKISDQVNTEEDEPEFLYTSTMHGDETTGFILMLRLADSLLTNYGVESEITHLVDEIEIYINPIANPDGTYRTDNNTISSPTRLNSNGVDLNRNFPDPVAGDHPDYKAWQAETIAMMNFAKENRICMSANFHGGIEVANYPWDNWFRRHTDDGWLMRVSRDYASSCQNNSPAGYFNDLNNGITNGYDWYQISGGRQDYFTYFHNSREVTMEISTTKMVSASVLPDYWNYNKNALLQFMKECLFGIRGTVKDIYGNPLNAMITIENHDLVADSSMVFTDPDVGDYHRMIESGTYNVIASSKGYTTDTIKNIAISDLNSVRVDFILEVEIISALDKDELIRNSNDVKIYPNPFSENIWLEFIPVQDEIYTIEIIDVRGNQIYYGLVNAFLNEGKNISLSDHFDLNKIKAGIYFIKLSNSQICRTHRVIKI